MLLMLFNSVMRSARVPDDRQMSIIIPVYKGNDLAKSGSSSLTDPRCINIVRNTYSESNCQVSKVEFC